MKTVYHSLPANSSRRIQEIEPFGVYEGVVIRRTSSGCIAELRLFGGASAMCYVYGAFNVGDRLMIGITGIFDGPGKYPRGVCEYVLEYAPMRHSRSDYDANCTPAP